MEPVEEGTRWVHKSENYGVEIVAPARNGIVFDEVKTKDAEAANWSDAVCYVRDDEDGTLHVRAEDDFLDKFEFEAAAEGDEDGED